MSAGDGVAAPFERVRVVLCDADGNLFPSEDPAFVASADVTNRFLAEHGVGRQYGAEELRLATTGLNFRTTLAALAQGHGLGVLTAPEVEAWLHTEQKEVTAYLQTVLEPDPEVLGPLTALADRYAVAAVSSSADARIAACFEVTGLAGFFPADRRFSAEDSLPKPASKPDPAIYRHALTELGLEPAEAVAVEDSLAGATAAVAAEIPTLGNLQFVAPEEREARRAQLEEAGVTAIVSSWSEAARLLGVSPPPDRAA